MQLSETKATRREAQSDQSPLVHPGPRAVLVATADDYVISIREAAGILGVCSRTVWRLIENRKLSAIRLSERRRGILASDLRQYMKPDNAV